MGGAGRAAVDPGEVAFLNPASLAHLGRYYVSGVYGASSHPVDGDSWRIGALLADGSAGNIVSGSLSYIRRFADLLGQGRREEQDIQISLAGFALKNLAVGLGLRRLYHRPEVLTDGKEFVQDNAHLGLLYTPFEWLGLGAVAYNLIPASSLVPIEVRVIPSLGLGGHLLIYNILRLRLDVVRPDLENPDRRADLMAGLETLFDEHFAFRLGGYWRETAQQTYLTTGLGFRGPRLSFSYSLQRDVRTAEGSRHLFDMWLPF
jgi:hypothetical protein